METKPDIYDVVVIGGGASGLMAAGRAGMLGKKVLLLEKNRTLGEKLKITGGGRCNITNANYDTRSLLANFGDASEYLFSTFSQFAVKDTFKFFEDRGLPLIIEANNRAFPKTEKATDVLNVLIKFIQAGKVTVKTASAVTKFTKEGGRIKSVIAGGGEYFGKNFIVATGGNSHPETGSTGDGFLWLRHFDHKVKAPTATIVPLATSDKWSHILSGISLEEMKITFFINGKKAFAKTGKLLFTHFGLSGPLILNSAGKVADLIQGGEVTAKIDVYPTLDIGALDKKIVGIFEDNKNRLLKNVLKDLVPAGIAPGIAILLKDLDLNTQVNSVTKENRRVIVDLLKALPVNVTGLMGLERAVVADGGVSLDEIDTKTMRSKRIDNLFVTGDLLHIRRPSGGFSLQLCWTTGWVAGSNA